MQFSGRKPEASMRWRLWKWNIKIHPIIGLQATAVDAPRIKVVVKKQTKSAQRRRKTCEKRRTAHSSAEPTSTFIKVADSGRPAAASTSTSRQATWSPLACEVSPINLACVHLPIVTMGLGTSVLYCEREFRLGLRSVVLTHSKALGDPKSDSFGTCKINEANATTQSSVLRAVHNI